MIKKISVKKTVKKTKKEDKIAYFILEHNGGSMIIRAKSADIIRLGIFLCLGKRSEQERYYFLKMAYVVGKNSKGETVYYENAEKFMFLEDIGLVD